MILQIMEHSLLKYLKVLVEINSWNETKIPNMEVSVVI